MLAQSPIGHHGSPTTARLATTSGLATTATSATSPRRRGHGLRPTVEGVTASCAASVTAVMLVPPRGVPTATPGSPGGEVISRYGDARISDVRGEGRND